MVPGVDEILRIINDFDRRAAVDRQLDAVLGGQGVLDDLLGAVRVDKNRHRAGFHVGNGNFHLGFPRALGQFHLDGGGGAGITGSLDFHRSLDGLAGLLRVLDGLAAESGFRRGLAVFVGLHRTGGAVSGLGLGDGATVGVGGGLDGGAVLLCLSLDLGAVGPGLGLNLGAVGPGGGGGLAGTAGTAAATAAGTAAGRAAAAALCSHGHSADSRFLAVYRFHSDIRRSYRNSGHITLFIDRSDRWLIAAPRNIFIVCVVRSNCSCQGLRISHSQSQLRLVQSNSTY